MTNKAPIKIIGIGSPQPGDDTGWNCVEALQQNGFSKKFPEGTLSFHQLTIPIHLVDLLMDCRYAVIIDSMPGKVGEILELSLHDLENQSAGLSVHGVGVEISLALLEVLKDAPSEITILGIGVDPDNLESTEPESDGGLFCKVVNQLSLKIEQIIKNRIPSMAMGSH